MNAVPAVIPVSSPEAALTVALAGILLLHAPPPGVAFSVVTLPIQTTAVPPIADGVPFTVTARVAAQPVAVSL